MDDKMAEMLALVKDFHEHQDPEWFNAQSTSMFGAALIWYAAEFSALAGADLGASLGLFTQAFNVTKVSATEMAEEN